MPSAERPYPWAGSMRTTELGGSCVQEVANAYVRRRRPAGQRQWADPFRQRPPRPHPPCGVGTLVATISCFLVHLPALSRSGLRLRWRFDLRKDPRLRLRAVLAVPAIVTALAQQPGIVVYTTLASSLGPGMVDLV